MKTRKIAGRGRVSASLAVSMALLGGAAAATGVPTASAAPPAEDCAVAFPVDDLQADDAVTAKSVVKGTAPVEFTGTVLGVLDDGIAPQLDMVMVEITPPEPDRIGGIWQGMSGSPVYAADGRLIGAIAYGLSWGPSWIAGVTPFEEMAGHLATPLAARVPVGDRAARRISAATDVTTSQAAGGFTQLGMPLGVSGFGATQAATDRIKAARRLQQDRHAQYLPKNTFAMGASGAAAATVDTVVAGGNLAVSQSYGNITMGGVGTATSVCGNRVVGFGHPATFRGDTTMSLHPAEALFIQPESLGAPFKLANLGEPVGTINGDHLAGVSGTFDTLPRTSLVSAAVDYKDNDRAGSSKVSVPDAGAAVTFYQQLAIHDRALDSIRKGSELMTWTIEGRDADETPFTFEVTDRYASEYDIAFASPWDVADTVWMLNSLADVEVDSVKISSTVIDDSSIWRVKGVEQKRDGQWTKVNRRHAVIAEAGQQLKLRTLLETTGGVTTYQPITMDVPRKAAGYRGYLQVAGGASTWAGWRFNSVEDIAKLLDRTVRNDALAGEFRLYTRRDRIERSVETEPTDKVVRGNKYFSMKVKR